MNAITKQQMIERMNAMQEELERHRASTEILRAQQITRNRDTFTIRWDGGECSEPKPMSGDLIRASESVLSDMVLQFFFPSIGEANVPEGVPTSEFATTARQKYTELRNVKGRGRETFPAFMASLGIESQASRQAFRKLCATPWGEIRRLRDAHKAERKMRPSLQGMGRILPGENPATPNVRPNWKAEFATLSAWVVNYVGGVRKFDTAASNMDEQVRQHVLDSLEAK
jgi:hypothetical protein